MMEGEQQPHHQTAVVLVPFPAQGHLNQLLQLSCLFTSSYKLPVYYVGSAIHNRQAKSRINGLSPSDVAKIHFHDIPTPHNLDSPPQDLNIFESFPTLLQSLCRMSLKMREPLAVFLQDISEKFKRIVVIHDSNMAMAVQDAALIPNAESYAFLCISAYSHLSFISNHNNPDECIPEDVLNFLALQNEASNHRSGDLYNTCRSIEEPYVDALENREISMNRKIWAVGPILPTKLSLSSDTRHKCLEWLDEQEPKSVIYVSFGTSVSLGDDQIKELALGLEQSRVKFLWVLRDADKPEGDVFDGQVRKVELPKGFEERTEGVGMVVRDWAPQPQILAHLSTGGFLSHCGWNSCIESITMGVPIAAWPMHSDQPANTVLITEILRMGIVVRGWEQRREIVKASSVESVVRRLMGSGEGDGIRKRAEEVGDTVQRATRGGGVSRVEMDSFVAHITTSQRNNLQ